MRATRDFRKMSTLNRNAGAVFLDLPIDHPYIVICVYRNVLSSQEVVDFVSERIKPDQSGNIKSLSSIVEEVSEIVLHCNVARNDKFHKYINHLLCFFYPERVCMITITRKTLTPI